MPYDRGPIKRVSLVRLRRDVPRNECVAAWFGAHAEIVRELPEVAEYVVDLAGEPGGAGGWDAIAMLRFYDRASMERALNRPGVAQALHETRDAFAEAVEVVIVEEHVLIPARQAHT